MPRAAILGAVPAPSIRIALVVCLAVGAARAEAPEAAAQRLVDSGQSLYTLGDYERARRDFAAAHALVPGRPNPRRLLGLALARLGRCREAIEEFDAFLRAVAPDDPRVPEVAVERRRCEEGLPARPGTVVVESEPTGATVRFDGGAPVGVTPWRGALPPGKHVLSLELPGHTVERRELDLEAGSTATFRLALLPSPPKRAWVGPVIGTAAVLLLGATAASLTFGLKR
jgi:tetratricopeptide (TPR) repeat protein